MEQLALFTPFSKGAREPEKKNTSGTFADNMHLPIHRWFRYSAGFSAEWVDSVIRKYRPDSVLDPFAGSGTTLLAAQQAHTKSYGFEAHPFIMRIAKAKLSWNFPIKDFLSLAANVLKRAQQQEVDISAEAQLIQKCYMKESLKKLCSLRDSFLCAREDMPTPARDMIWLAITTILRPCSSVGTAQWQYVLPTKNKARVVEPYEAYRAKIDDMAADMQHFQFSATSKARLIEHDARQPWGCLDGAVDLVITSPPYPNNYDYGDSTRLEMCFWHEISSWSDLQHVVRRYLVRSCSQHSAAEKLKLDEVLAAPLLTPIQADLAEICHNLEKERLNHGGRKTYHTMIAAYFADLAAVFWSLRSACRPGSSMCFVVGDSAPYGIYVPVDEFLGKLAISAGFYKYSFEKIRDRNIKWKNRKHRVPLKEGRLWIEG